MDTKQHKNDADLVPEARISIAMGLDNNYLYPTIISMLSVLKNRDEKTSCDFYIMHSPEFEEINKTKLLSLREKYENSDISLINMGESFKNASCDARISTPSYYRLALSELLPGLERIIWLDGDTLTFGDLTEMWRLDMEGYHYKGFLDYSHRDITEPFGIRNDHYICAGVMLVNLKELRRDNAPQRYEAFIKDNSERLYQHDQTVINVVSFEKTGALPAKYGMPNSFTESSAVQYVLDLLTPSKYTVGEFLDAWASPVIAHCYNKPWKGFAYSDIWWRCAEESGFIEEIKQKYG